MNKIRELSDQVFDNLTVLHFLRIDENRRAIWLVRCTCKNKIEMRGARLTDKYRPATHCGCLTSINHSNARKKNQSLKYESTE